MLKQLVKISLVFFVLISLTGMKDPTYQVAVMKYRGGGDYYANPTAVPNLVSFVNKNLGLNISKDVPYVEPGSPEIYNFPFVHLTGHGNVIFTPSEVDNLRKYLLAGGFLHIDDNYGMDQFIRPQMKRVFPELEFVELPFNHPIYHQKYNFSSGLPKIHEHDGKPAEGLGLIFEGRLVCFYSYESDLGDGWEDQAVHKDSEDKRKQALEMGSNILQYALMGEGHE